MDTSSDDDARDAIHDPSFSDDRLDHLVLLALGEAAPAAFEAHHADCAECQQDLAAISHTVALGREGVANPQYLDARPPASVWAGIAAEVGLDSAPPRHRRASARPAAGARRRRLPLRSRYAVAAAAAVLACGVAVSGGYLAGRSAGPQPTRLAANAQLATVRGGPTQSTGAAAVHVSGDGRQLTVTTAGLPLRNGFYEVWLFDPDRGSSGDMVAVGALGDRGRGTFTLPGGIDLRNYHVVNISAQDYGGGSSIVHAQSVLQGSLSQ